MNAATDIFNALETLPEQVRTHVGRTHAVVAEHDRLYVRVEVVFELTRPFAVPAERQVYKTREA